MARFVGFGKETTYGTQVSLTDYINAIDESYSIDNSVDAEVVMGTRYDDRPAPGPVKVKGGFKCYADQESLGRILHALMGSASDTITTPESGVYLHTMIPSQTAQPLTLAVGGDVAAGQKSMPGTIVKKLTVTISPKGKVLCEVETVGKSMYIDALASPTFSIKKTYHNVHAVCKIGGSQIARIKGMKMVIENKVTEDDFVHGSRTLYSCNFEKFTVTGTIDLFFDAIDQWKMFMGNSTALSPGVYLTPQAIAIELTSDEKAGATQYYFLKFQIVEAIYKTHKCIIKQRDRTIENIDFQMVLPVAGGNPFTILYQNTVTPAYN